MRSEWPPNARSHWLISGRNHTGALPAPSSPAQSGRSSTPLSFAWRSSSPIARQPWTVCPAFAGHERSRGCGLRGQ
jgi:hypothetical protein